MAQYRARRLEQELRQEIDDTLLKDVHDPRLKGVNVTGVKVSGDLQHANVYYTKLQANDDNLDKKVQQGLDKVKGLIRSKMAKRIRIYKIPDLHFYVDESISYGNKIDRMLNNLRTNKLDK